MGIPLSFLGLFNDKDEFYDTKIGGNISIARHALAIDEHRSDFIPTVWIPQAKTDIKQVWFSGAHSNIGGSYKPDQDGSLLSDIPLAWMLKEAKNAGLSLENHILQNIKPNSLATLHNSRRTFYRVKKKFYRSLSQEEPGAQKVEVLIHHSVKERWENNAKYRPQNLQEYLESYAWPSKLVT
jgi:uncharacterized protein (DUF2235 family)